MIATRPPGDASADPPGVIPHPARAASSITYPLLIWLVEQLLALILAAWRVPLSARYPEAGERWAIEVLLTIQIASVALILPMLARNLLITIAVIATSWPALAAAGALSATPWPHLMFAGLLLSLWITALACWRMALPRWESLLTCIASVWALGGPLLWYFGSEFATPGISRPINTGLYGPVFWSYAALGPGPLPMGNWLPLVCLLACGIAAAWASWRMPHHREREEREQRSEH